MVQTSQAREMVSIKATSSQKDIIFSERFGDQIGQSAGMNDDAEYLECKKPIVIVYICESVSFSAFLLSEH